MAWFFESTGTDVSFHISQHGTFYATGQGKQNFSAMTGEVSDLKRLAKVQTGIWGIYPPIKDELIFDGASRNNRISRAVLKASAFSASRSRGLEVTTSR